MEILKAPNKLLNSKCLPVHDPIYDTDAVIYDMKKVMRDADGMGLAAPQVGIPSRFFLMRGELICNPEILESSGIMLNPEGCLSLSKDLVLPIERPKKIVVFYEVYEKPFNVRYVQRDLEGEEACIFQHELDHLDGILITRRFAEQFAERFESV